MKKTIKLLLAIAVAALTFHSCADVPAPYQIPSEGGNGGDDGVVKYLDETFETDFGDFTVKTIETDGFKWTINYKTATATGYDSSAKINKKSEGYLISPEIDLTNSTNAYLTFEYIFRYANNDGENKVYITDNYTGNPQTTAWEDITGTLTEGTDWNTFAIYAQNIAEKFIGKKGIHIAFYFNSSEKSSRTWEIKNVKVLEGKAEESSQPDEDLGTPEAPLTVAQALTIISGYKDKQQSTGDAYVKGKIAAISTTDPPGNSYGNATYEISDDGTTGNTLTVFRGYFGPNQKNFTSADDIKVGDEVVVVGKLYLFKDTKELAQGNYIYMLNGQTSGGGDTPSGDAKGTGTQNDPFNVAAAIAKCQETGQTATNEEYYVKGIADTDFTVPDDNYKNATFDMVDAEGSSERFKAFRVLGPNGQKLKAGYKIPKGATVIVHSKLVNYRGNTPETVQTTSPAYNGILVSVNGQAPELDGQGGGNTPTPGNPQGTGTQNDPFNVAAAVAKCQETGQTATNEEYYVKGIADADCTIADDNYKNATFDMVDVAGATEKFKAYRVLGPNGQKLKAGYKIPKGATVIVYGKLVNFRGNTPETVQTTSPAYNGILVSVNGQAPELDGQGGGGESGGGESGGGGSAVTSLTNGNFETWANGLPTGWKSASTASTATLEQSTDAHGGTYSCIVKGDEGYNKRLASQEITLAAGTYVFSAWVKATTSDASQARLGYVPIGADGKAGTYIYANYVNLSNSWQQFSQEFTLDSEKTVCLVIMNPKKSNLSSGKNILVDDITLIKK